MTSNITNPRLITRLAACALLAAYFSVAAFTPSSTAAQQPTPKVRLSGESNSVHRAAGLLKDSDFKQQGGVIHEFTELARKR
jgi:hypothetical protein